jgi:hypothetical protein
MVRLRIALTLAWLAVGIALLAREEFFPADVLAKYDGPRLTLGGWLAVALAAWNGIRAYRAKAVSRPIAPNPLRPVRRTKPAGEYHPEFDFSQPINQDTGGKPSTSTG